MPAMPSPVRARLRGVVSACAALGLLAGGSVALADDKEPGVQERKERVDEKIDTLDSQLHDTSTQLTATYFRLRSTRSKIPGAKDALATSERARDSAAQKHDEAREELAVARERLDRSRRDLRRTSQKVKDAREDVAGYAAQMYETQGVGVDLDVALGAQTPQQAVDQMAMADTVGDVRSATVGELSTTKADLVAKEDNLSALEDEVAVIRQEADLVARVPDVLVEIAERFGGPFRLDAGLLLDGALELVVGERQHDDLGARGELRHDRQPPAVGHAHVEQDDVGLGLLGPRDGLLAVGRLAHDDEARRARELARDLGLPRGGDELAEWAALGALEVLVGMQDDGGRREALIIDASGSGNSVTVRLWGTREYTVRISTAPRTDVRRAPTRVVATAGCRDRPGVAVGGMRTRRGIR